jgi:hypothetical protein
LVERQINTNLPSDLPSFCKIKTKLVQDCCSEILEDSKILAPFDSTKEPPQACVKCGDICQDENINNPPKPLLPSFCNSNSLKVQACCAEIIKSVNIVYLGPFGATDPTKIDACVKCGEECLC